MKKLWLSIVLGVVAIGGGAARAQAQGAAAAQPQIQMSKPPVTYGYDLRPQILLDLDQMQQKFVSLAEAIPADKYTWRPADGVRSIAEVYLHVAAANYGFPQVLGGEMPERVKAKDWEKSTTDKDKIVAELKESFANAITVITKVPTSDIATPMPKLGPDANKGDVEYALMTHMREHLGQSIAYARAVGVTPPWTVAAEAAAKKKAAEGKPTGQQPE
ncbi:MAG: DinB family protein [Candidatus Acidiferrales bacterium]